MESNYQNIIGVKFARAEQPKFIEKKSKGYVEFGEDNKYPLYLLDLFKESPKHGAIVKGKANYIYGKGFQNITQDANPEKETWNKILKKSVLDDEIHARFYLQMVWNLMGKIKGVYHIPAHKVRQNKEKSKFFVKNDWCDNKEEVREYTAFTGKYDPEYPTQILLVEQYAPDGEVYPVPSYFQGLNYIDADVQVSRHILGNAKDGFVAGTFINFNNGEPAEDQKGELEKGLKKKFTGSEGDRVVIAFNKSKDNAAEILPLAQTQLTKEDFTNINNLIQQEIFASHQVTSPTLFGISTPGSLGQRNEIKDAYEIFNNTYVNERQQAHEELFGRLMAFCGIQGEAKIMPVEPLGFTLEDSLLLEILPREYFLDKLSVDQKYYAMPAAKGGAAYQQQDPSGAMGVNSHLKGMTGRQFQHLDRVKRKFERGQLTREQAAMMLRNSFGLTDDDISLFLDANSDDQQFASQEEMDFALLEQFGAEGENKDQYEILSKRPAGEVEYFAEVKELTQLESNIINLIGKDKRITPEVIAKTLKRDLKEVKQTMELMEKNQTISVKVERIGQDEIFERSINNRPPGYKPTTTDILLRYSYEGPEDERNRPFCAKLMGMKKLYSRSDIERISERLGYSVWDRRGGWLTQADGTARPSCRHKWFALTVIKKS